MYNKRTRGPRAASILLGAILIILLANCSSGGSQPRGTGTPATKPRPVPYTPPWADYAVEVRFQIASVPQNGGYFVITADRVRGKDGYTAGIAGLLSPAPHSEFANPLVEALIDPPSSMDTPMVTSDYEPGSNWHTYRIEVQGSQVKFFIDDVRKSIATSTQTATLSNGPIHLHCAVAVVRVASVRVTTL
jgi:hypothetical protein